MLRRMTSSELSHLLQWPKIRDRLVRAKGIWGSKISESTISMSSASVVNALVYVSAPAKYVQLFHGMSFSISSAHMWSLWSLSDCPCNTTLNATLQVVGNGDWGF